ncbi:hypothetical protein A3F06_01115 [candidate division TM6 bacterium RIFCSPHIGHO2_12_FULL_36_22]|nr:MAG: hypothetical protein A3F06_01115 [candidate division TM6 bacterium RIFCSPHIGHO2_12_FULL_36_22]
MLKQLKTLVLFTSLLSCGLAFAREAIFGTKRMVGSSGAIYDVRYNLATYTRNPFKIEDVEAEFKKLYTNPNFYRKCREALVKNSSVDLPLNNPNCRVSVKVDLSQLEQVVHNYYDRQLSEVSNRDYVSFWVDWKNKFEWHQLNTEKDAVLESLSGILKEQMPSSLTKRSYMLLAGAALAVGGSTAAYYYRDQINNVLSNLNWRDYVDYKALTVKLPSVAQVKALFKRS